MVDKQRAFAKMLGQGVSISEACRRLGIDRKTGHWWKNGGVIVRESGTRIVKPVVGRYQGRAESGRYLSEAERVRIADGVRVGRRRGRSRLISVGRCRRRRVSWPAIVPVTAATIRSRRTR